MAGRLTRSGPLIRSRVTRSAPYRCAAVVGASGSGKSSLLRAGLIPRLREYGGVGFR
ncbi:nSTAND1 domain-containing NTPase, partial [Streptomyces sp. NPDC001002]